MTITQAKSIPTGTRVTMRELTGSVVARSASGIQIRWDQGGFSFFGFHYTHTLHVIAIQP